MGYYARQTPLLHPARPQLSSAPPLQTVPTRSTPLQEYLICKRSFCCLALEDPFFSQPNLRLAIISDQFIGARCPEGQAEGPGAPPHA
jgi:hypothetical protein